MRTTIDLPDELYRTLKTRAAIRGVTMRQLVQGLIEQALAHPEPVANSAETRERPPVAIPTTGVPITLTAEDIHRLEQEDDLARHARSSRR